MNPAVLMMNAFLIVVIVFALYFIFKIGSSLLKSADKESAIDERKNDIKETAELAEKISIFKRKNRDAIETYSDSEKSINNFINGVEDKPNPIDEEKGDAESIDLNKS